MPFVITRTLNVKRIDLDTENKYYNSTVWKADAATGKLYHILELYDSAEKAVAAGRERLQAQKEKHQKAANNIGKRERNLNKFAQSLKQGA